MQKKRKQKRDPIIEAVFLRGLVLHLHFAPVLEAKTRYIDMCVLMQQSINTKTLTLNSINREKVNEKEREKFATKECATTPFGCLNVL